VRTFDEQLTADPQIGSRVLASARGLALHRMMRDRGAHWDELPETDKLTLVAEASVVLAAADRS
jgi:hypothetical protein